MNPIISEIKPYCYALHEKMKEAKEAQHKTNQAIADETGVPLSNIAKFFSGALANPGVYNVAAVCICLGLSLDTLMGIAPNQDKGESKHIADLELQVHDLQKDLASTEKELRINKKIEERLEAQIREMKALIFRLTVLCLILVVGVFCYFISDIKVSDAGLVRQGVIQPVAYAVMVPLLAAVVAFVLHILKLKKKRDDSNG